MARTALDLTSQERKAYKRAWAGTGRQRRASPQITKRRQQAWRLARRAAGVLRREFGASRVVVFGSLSHPAWFTERSDIDLAAWDIPPDRFYSAVAMVTGLSPFFRVDLVDLDTCRRSLRQAMEADGIEI